MRLRGSDEPPRKIFAHVLQGGGLGGKQVRQGEATTSLQAKGPRIGHRAIRRVLVPQSAIEQTIPGISRLVKTLGITAQKCLTQPTAAN